MTVKELIEALKNCPEDATVAVWDVSACDIFSLEWVDDDPEYYSNTIVLH